jgi:hypothetical protein
MNIKTMLCHILKNNAEKNKNNFDLDEYCQFLAKIAKKK